jgi:single-strand DNA-binding protein
MAAIANSILLIGNLTRDPELRFSPNGTPVASFSIAVNKRTQNKQSGEWESEADFFNIVAWFKLAENIAESLGKGDRVLVSGRLSQESWDDKQGQKHTSYRIMANVVAPSLEFASCKIEKNPRTDSQVPSSVGDNEVEQDLDFSNDDIPF